MLFPVSCEFTILLPFISLQVTLEKALSDSKEGMSDAIKSK